MSTQHTVMIVVTGDGTTQGEITIFPADVNTNAANGGELTGSGSTAVDVTRVLTGLDINNIDATDGLNLVIKRNKTNNLVIHEITGLLPRVGDIGGYETWKEIFGGAPYQIFEPGVSLALARIGPPTPDGKQWRVRAHWIETATPFPV